MCARHVISALCDLDFEAAIFIEGEDQACSTAQATCVWFNFRDNQSQPIPAAKRAVIVQFEGIES